MNNYFKYYMLFFLILNTSCNKNVKGNNKPENNVHSEKERVIITKSKLDEIEGVWLGEKDINQSISYRVQYGKKVLDLVCLEGDCNGDNLFVETSFLGFCKTNDLKKLQSNLEHINKAEFIKPNGRSVMVKWSDSIFIDQNYSINAVFYTTRLVSDYMLDEINTKQSSFVKLKSLPNYLFSSISKKKGSFIKDYNISELSSKIKVVSNKTYFYNGMTEDTKRKAFLIKNDVAYLEDITGEWAKIYYDGKTITSGYVKLKDVSVIH